MPAQDPRRSGNPATRSKAGSAGQPPADEAAFYRWSRVVLVRLSTMPIWILPGVILVLLLVGLTAPLPVALPALVVCALLVLWLVVLSWEILDFRGRMLRVVLLGLLVFSIVGRIVSR